MNFRKIYLKQNDILSTNKLVFVLGPRQVGKTTFLKEIYNGLQTKNKQFLNLDNFEFYSFFKNFSSFQAFVNSVYDGNGKFYLFLDEFQKIKNIDIILKLIYDEMPFVKVILSGSNNIQINKNIKESLAGRKIVYYMRPLDFNEFVLWKENLGYEQIDDFIKNPLNKNKLYSYLEEFMIWGGYPEVVLAKSFEQKKQALASIFDFWFNRDILIHTNKLYEFKELTKQISYNIGNCINYSKLGSLSNLTGPTVKIFIEVLKETFIAFTQGPYFNNKLKEINKSPKIYFFDNGFRSYFINRFEYSTQEKGVLFENVVLTELIKAGYDYDSLKFWRTNDENYEVDLIFDNNAFELKYKNTKSITVSDYRGIKKFSSIYSNFYTSIINKDNFISGDYIDKKTGS